MAGARAVLQPEPLAPRAFNLATFFCHSPCRKYAGVDRDRQIAVRGSAPCLS